MKTLKKQTDISIQNSNCNSFFKKANLLFILLFTFFFFFNSTKSFAQLRFNLDVNNNASCDFLVKTFDGGGVFLDSFLSLAGSGLMPSGCFTSGLVTVYRIDVIDNSGGGCGTTSFYATSTSSGTINYAAFSPGCACTSSITCAGGGGGTICGGTNDYNYLIEIKP